MRNLASKCGNALALATGGNVTYRSESNEKIRLYPGTTERLLQIRALPVYDKQSKKAGVSEIIGQESRCVYRFEDGEAVELIDYH